MTTPQPTMLWESSDAQAALTRRFQFATAADAAAWLTATLAAVYGVRVDSVDRLVISSANLLAWLSTDVGPLLAKSCAWVTYQERLSQLARLLAWLDQQGLPVSAPRRAISGEGQVLCGHLSVGVQRLIEGEWLDPTQPAQAQAAGTTLAQLHRALSSYPDAADLAPATPLVPLPTKIQSWVADQRTKQTAPELLATLTTIEAEMDKLGTVELPTQLIHHDYRAANLLWRNGQIAAVLDFEDARWGYRIHDLAWATTHLSTRFHNWGPVAPEVHATFLASYCASCPLTADEEAWLPLLLIVYSIELMGPTTSGPHGDLTMQLINQYTRQLTAQK